MISGPVNLTSRRYWSMSSSASSVQSSRHLIRHAADVPVLLSAMASKPDWLLTHNIKHFTQAVILGEAKVSDTLQLRPSTGGGRTRITSTFYSARFPANFREFGSIKISGLSC